ncbi:MAG: lactate racemase domain-containing protein [Candidatus Rokuibacteriota bacterium]
MKLTGVPRAPQFPQMVRVKQQFSGPMLPDVAGSVREALTSIALPIRRGHSVALPVGSRGVVNIDVIVRATVDHLNAVGARPFIFPAMGSHGGATVLGQRSVLEHYGVTEDTMGCPIRATMDVVQIGDVLGLPIWLDRHAAEADWIGVINRVKPHTGFSGELGSGLLKMMTIGMGKHRGAVQAHRANIRRGYETMITALGREMLRAARIAFGLGIVENGYDETALVQAFAPDALEAGERELLRRAKAWMAKLPFDVVDLLVVDEIGKEISGTGMDTHVIGRHATFFERPSTSPKITFIVACDLTPNTHGNANGIGLADFTTRRLADKIDWEPTYVNALTACSPSSPKLPAVLDTARDAIGVALACLGLERPEEARVVRIKNTLRLGEVEVSEALLPELATRPDLTRLSDPAPLAFDPDGHLPPF